MKPFATCALFGAFALAMHSASFANVPCEDTLKDVRGARSSAKLSDTDVVKVDELINKGIDRCNADDDDRANGFFKQAMSAMGK
ncbi:hypothetical protein [Ensifer sp.]|uniref:hypothetical protein n=1 Tax=Ensifer sp. TaxID=1872086 RepID=UPI002E12A0FB|nr:hypothetical protein [Ensifer sp.]